MYSVYTWYLIAGVFTKLYATLFFPKVPKGILLQIQLMMMSDMFKAIFFQKIYFPKLDISYLITL